MPLVGERGASGMNKLTQFRIHEELESSEVAALCFLCRDVVNRKRLERIEDAKDLFSRLEEKGLLENSVFLSQLLNTIRRADLLSLLETDSRQTEETDANPVLSDYRVMLYQIYEDTTQENVEKIKFLLSSKLSRRQLETCNTALDVFSEMEKVGLLSNKNLGELYAVLKEIDRHLALTVKSYIEEVTQQHQRRSPPQFSIDHQMVNSTANSVQPLVPVSETQPSPGRGQIYSDADPSAHFDQAEYYPLNRIPRGLCVVINNEFFAGMELKNRRGTQEDEKALNSVFTQLGFTVVVHNNLTAKDIQDELNLLSRRNFLNHDALVVCVLSHGEEGCVFGTDEKAVSIRELTQPFTSRQAPTLTGKPKLFFIQACQGNSYQRASVPLPSWPDEEAADKHRRLEADAGRVPGWTVPADADFLIGMATVPECKSFRNTITGSIYIQELCRQLRRSAESSRDEDILNVLVRVNREVSKGEFMSYKQMPEPKYTLTRRLVLKPVNPDQG